jgi:Flp pilus assembly protein TadG
VKLATIWRDRSGASALEFGLIAPVFFLFIFTIIELGLLLWTQLGMQHGVALAARCASINPTLCSGSNAITSYAAQQAFGLSLTSQTFTYSTPACGNQVSGSYEFQFPQFLNLSPLTLTAQACFPS